MVTVYKKYIVEFNETELALNKGRKIPNTYMRIEREVQVLSELGYRGATPVLKHVQIGLALKLQTQSHRKEAG